MPGRYSSISLNLPGDAVGDIVVGLLAAFGFSVVELARARTTAKRVFNDRLFINLRQYVFPAVQARLPIRTGRLKRSFRLHRRGNNAVFTTIFYGEQKVVRPRPRQTVRQVIVEELDRRAGAVVGQALQAALDAV